LGDLSVGVRALFRGSSPVGLWKNENFNIYGINSEKGKVISGNWYRHNNKGTRPFFSP
jgi:hypothetical protein